MSQFGGGHKDTSPVNKLTEFPPLEPEDRSDGGKFSISKLLWWRKNDTKADSDASSLGSSISDTVLNTNTIVSDVRGEGKTSLDSMKDKGNSGPAGQGYKTPSTSAIAPQSPSSFHTSSHHSGRLHISINRVGSLYRSDSTLSSRSNPSPEISESGTVSPFEARTLPNVLRRISSLIAMGTNNQSDIKKYWMPDSVSKECYDCAEKFTTFRRKHHCRICGQIFCSRCCNQEIPGKIIGYSGDLRVCTYCCKIVLSYLQSADLSTDLNDELRLVQEDLQNRFGGGHDSLGSLNTTPQHQHIYGSLPSNEHLMPYRSLPRRRASLVYQEERFISGRSGSNPNIGGADELLQSTPEDYTKKFGDWVSIKALWDDLCHPVTGIDWTTHRHNMKRNYSHCVVGSELVDWLLAQRKIAWRGQGVQIGQMLVDVNLIECISQVDQIFLDAYALYRPVQIPLTSVREDPNGERSNATSTRSSTDMGGQEPLWVKQISTNNANSDRKMAENYDELSFEEENTSIDTEASMKPRLPSANSLYSLDLNTSEAKVTLSKPKETSRNLVDPYYNSSDGKEVKKTTPKLARKNYGTGGSSTTETMTDEFLQKTYLSQKGRQGGGNGQTSWHTPHQLTSDNEVLAFQRLCNAFVRHENDFLLQLLEKMKLSSHWIDIILPIVHNVTEIVKPDVRYSDDDMDIRQYIHFKKVPGGKREDCRIVNGVVCTKNVAHRDMKQKRKGAKILLIGSSIDYQRFENRFLSLEPLVMQEHDYLKNTISRIVSAGPDIVLVEKTVSRLAQEFLLSSGLTLVLNVKGSVMERVARLTQGVIESSADSPIGKPQLGLCHNFYLETFKAQLTGGRPGKKTLMFFDGCAMHLGCTLLLRGGTQRELRKVKQVISFLMFVAYNWRLERSLHIDLFTMAPKILEPNSLSSALTEISANATNASANDVFASPLTTTEESDGEYVNAKDTFNMSDTSSPLAEQVKSTYPKTSTPTNGTEVVLTKVEPCNDMSDPLNSYLASGQGDISAVEESAITENKSEILDEINKQTTDCNTLLLEVTGSTTITSSFKQELESVLLSASPFIKYSLPYLETAEGKACKLRKYFPKNIYWSSKTYEEFQSGKEVVNSCAPVTPNIQWRQPHQFTKQKLTSSLISDHTVQVSLADFRRNGNRLDFNSRTLPPEIAEDEQDSGRDRCATATLVGSIDKELEVVQKDISPSVGKVDALDPFRHQRLAVLFSSFSRISTNMPNFCVHPWVVNMDLYGRNDISLGMFLERYCFRKTYLCPARQCDTPMLHHLRRFVHEQGCVTIALKELEKPIAGSGENILMWNGCSVCKTVCPIIPMSADAWSVSFAKYLELRFHGDIYKRRPIDDEVQKVCDHSLHNEFVHYFAQENIMASFSYSLIRIWEIGFPVLFISLKRDPKSVASLIEDIKVVAITGHGVFSNILEALCSIKETCVGLRVEDVVNTFLEHLKAERAVFRSKIEGIQLNLTSANQDAARERNELDAFLWNVTDSIGFLKANISETIQSWNTRFNDLFVLRKKEEKQAKASQQGNSKGDELQDSTQKSLSRLESDPSQSQAAIASLSTSRNNVGGGGALKNADEPNTSTTEAVLDVSTDSRNRDRSSETSGSTLDISISGVLEELTKTPLPAVNFLQQQSKLGHENPVFTSLSDINSSTASSKSVDSVIASVERTKSVEPTEKVLKAISDNSTGEDSLENKDKKSSGGAMKNLISHFMSNTVAGQVVPSPWLPTEHYFQSSLTTIPVAVYENEPSSIVAFALSSNEYKTKSQEYINLKHKTCNPSIFPEDDINFASASKKSSRSENSSTDAMLNNSIGEGNVKQDKEKPKYGLVDEVAEVVDSQEKMTGHIEVQFTSGSAKFYCRVYFAEKFHQLRKTCIFNGSEEFYIRSISRCISWAASGGKSGSTFCKTIDDRFVIKQMSKFEIQSFLDFAPKYFNYMRSCYQEDKPTVLAKIVGVYRIGYKNSISNSASKLDILIMENLFYERSISQKFDLKGSIRNRLATASGKVQEDLVLLDENLVNMTCENPLYIRPHTKTVLSVALTNDSKFLSEQMVMDYSLLVGLDEKTNELVVGIIDYIRTFTWDKRLEAFVKSTGILGGQGKTPTVVSPEEYQARFCDAMDRYFLVVPDRWIRLGLGVD